jgi:hypothetical protein
MTERERFIVYLYPTQLISLGAPRMISSVAHMPEVSRKRGTHNPEVNGSNPARATSETPGGWFGGGSSDARGRLDSCPTFAQSRRETPDADRISEGFGQRVCPRIHWREFFLLTLLRCREHDARQRTGRPEPARRRREARDERLPPVDACARVRLPGHIERSAISSLFFALAGVLVVSAHDHSRGIFLRGVPC